MPMSRPAAEIEGVELDACRGILEEADDKDAAGDRDALDRDVFPFGDQRLPALAGGVVEVDGDDAIRAIRASG